jgi:uncharacterized SAM-binding protein YcdF (DUF218 family)
MSFKQYCRFGIIGFGSVAILWLGVVAGRLAAIARQVPQPQAMLILGGDPGREIAAAEIAQHYPNIDIWVSSGTAAEKSLAIFQAAGITEDRLHLDYKASDTVTNFTTLVPDLKAHNIQHLYLITSDFHMPRAQAIGTIVLGSKGIVFTPIAIADNRPQEPTSKVVRDVGRSLLWLMTGHTGASLEALKQ